MRLAAALTILALAAPAAAQDPPRIPTRDYAATYAMTGFSSEAPKTMQMSFNAALKRQRVDMAEDGKNMSMIMDLGGQRVWMIEHTHRVAMELTPGAGPGGELPLSQIEKDATLTRTGADRVAGLACTVYRVAHRGETTGTACITADGIMLRAEFEAGSTHGRVEATSVSLAAQPQERFEVPAGYQTMQMPGGMPGQPPRR